MVSCAGKPSATGFWCWPSATAAWEPQDRASLSLYGVDDLLHCRGRPLSIRCVGVRRPVHEPQGFVASCDPLDHGEVEVSDSQNGAAVRFWCGFQALQKTI